MTPCNLGEIIDRNRPRDEPWLIEVAQDGSQRTITFGEMHDQADGLARGLLARGHEAGDAVGILAANRAEYLLAVIGIMRAGMVAVPINVKLPPVTIGEIGSDSEITLILADEENADAAATVVESVVRIDDPAAWEQLLDNGPHESPDLAKGQEALHLYTSGSTGRPKGVPLTHAGYVWATRILVDTGPPLAGKLALIAAPLFHMNGLLQSVMTSVAGGTVVLMRHFSPASYLETAARFHCELLTSVPTMLALALREKDILDRRDFSHVEIITVGSAPSTEALFDAIAEVFPNARILNGWGTTESSPVVFGPHPEGKPRPKLSVGYPLPQAELKLVDGPDANQGVLWVKNRAMMSGYLNRPEETAKRIKDGWYDTGDVMRRDADGFFHFVGRADDMFVCGGENVYPAEVEKLLARHPAVSEVAVVPASDDVKGQIPIAFVVRRSGAETTEDEIKRFALDHAAPYLHPRAVVFMEKLPLSGTNKIDRALLSDKAAEFRR